MKNKQHHTSEIAGMIIAVSIVLMMGSGLLLISSLLGLLGPQARAMETLTYAVTLLVSSLVYFHYSSTE